MDINKYLNIRLSETPTKNNIIYKEGILEIIENANKELEKYYAGKYKFSLSYESNGIKPDKLKLSPKKKRKIKEI